MRVATSAAAIAFVLASAVILALVAPIARIFPDAPLLAIGAATAAATFVLTLLFIRIGPLSARETGIAPDRGSPARFLAGVGFGLGLVAVHTAAVAAFGHVAWRCAEAPSVRSVALVLVGFVLLACREELVFRGWPLKALARNHGPLAALLVTTLLFSIEHMVGGMRWDQALLGAGTGALLFGAAALWSGGLALPIGLHAAWNFGDWIRGNKGPGGFCTAVIDPGYEHRNSVIGMATYVATMVTALLVLRLVSRRFFESAAADRP